MTDITRKGLREQVKALLLGKTQAEERVYAARSIPVRNPALPCALVYVMSIRRQRRGLGSPPMFYAVVSLGIELVVDGTADEAMDDLLDTMQREVETALLCDPEFVAQFETVDTANVEIALAEPQNGQRRHAAARVSLELAYHEQFDPVVADTFSTVHIDVDAVEPFDKNRGPSGPDGRIEAALDVTLPQ